MDDAEIPLLRQHHKDLVLRVQYLEENLRLLSNTMKRLSRSLEHDIRQINEAQTQLATHNVVLREALAIDQMPPFEELYQDPWGVKP